jgi:hypothetical protein
MLVLLHAAARELRIGPGVAVQGGRPLSDQGFRTRESRRHRFPLALRIFPFNEAWKIPNLNQSPRAGNGLGL